MPFFPFVAGLLAAACALAQGYPDRPVRIIVPFAPAGLTDNSARVIAEPLAARLGQQVVVENRPGAGGNIGTQAVAQSAADGYTLLLGYGGTLAINPHVFAKIPFDTLNDLAPVTKLGDATLILVAHPSVRERYAALGIDPVGNSPEEFGAQVRADLARWEKVVRAANIRIE